MDGNMSDPGLIPSRILAALSDGEFTVDQLAAKLGLEQKAIKPNLKRLRADQKIILRRNGPVISYVAAEGHGQAPIRRKPRPAPVVSIPVDEVAVPPRRRARAPVALGLLAELALIKRRLTPIQDLRNKLQMLQTLATSTPKPVSQVLLAIMNDLNRYAD